MNFETKTLLPITRGDYFTFVYVTSTKSAILEKYYSFFLGSCKIFEKRDTISVN